MSELFEVSLQILVALFGSAASAIMGFFFSTSRHKTNRLKQLVELRNALGEGTPEYEQLRPNA